MQIKQSESTAARRRIPFFCFDDDSPYVPYTGLTFSAAELQVSKNGGTEGNSAGTVTEVGGGAYYYEATAGELSDLGFLSVRPAKTDVYSSPVFVQIVAFNPYSSTDLGLSTITTNLDVATSSRLAAANYQNIVAMLDEADTIETGLTLRNALRLVAAYAAGNVTGGGSGTEAFKAAVDSTKTRFTSFPTSAGSRTITYDFS